MAKIVFVNVIVNRKLDYSKIKKELLKVKENKIAICYTNQFEKVTEKIDDERIVERKQVLGCSNPKFVGEVEALLLIGQGKFHAISLAYESGFPTYVLEGEKIWKVTSEEIEKKEKKMKGAYLKYLTSSKVGILVSTKPGQERLNRAIEFKKNLKDTLPEHKNLQAGKKGYIFISNILDLNEWENFGIDCFVNTACPRMDLDEVGIINLEKLEKLNSSN